MSHFLNFRLIIWLRKHTFFERPESPVLKSLLGKPNNLSKKTAKCQNPQTSVILRVFGEKTQEFSQHAIASRNVTLQSD